MLNSIKTQVMPCVIRVAVLLAVPVTCAVIFIAIARNGDAPIHRFQMDSHPAAVNPAHGREAADLSRTRG